ncbi:MAG: NAD(P)H-dependent oxidoreductase subunit E, partial [Burkholderiaceae bacterium]
MSKPSSPGTEARIPVSAVRGGRAGRGGARTQAKGRQPAEAARDAVRALIGPGPHRRDQLIEHLHQLNDAHGALFEGHLVALAAEMRLSMAEVAEVASFYHHFDTLPDGAAAPALTVRVCDGLACTLAGAGALMQGLAAALGPSVRVQHAPCVGRCEQAPVAVVGQRPVPQAVGPAVAAHALRAELRHPLPPDDGQFEPAALAPGEVAVAGEVAPAYVGLAAYRAAGGYRLAAAVAAGERPADEVLAALE